MTFSNVGGSITINGGSNYNDPDGFGAPVSSSTNNGTSRLSGIIAPNAGYLVGVFVGATPPASAPPVMNFMSGAGNNPGTTAFASLFRDLGRLSLSVTD